MLHLGAVEHAECAVRHALVDRQAALEPRLGFFEVQQLARAICGAEVDRANAVGRVGEGLCGCRGCVVNGVLGIRGRPLLTRCIFIEDTYRLGADALPKRSLPDGHELAVELLGRVEPALAQQSMPKDVHGVKAALQVVKGQARALEAVAAVGLEACLTAVSQALAVAAGAVLLVDGGALAFRAAGCWCCCSCSTGGAWLDSRSLRPPTPSCTRRRG